MHKKKIPWLVYGIFGIFAAYFGYLCAAVYKPEGNIFTMYNQLMENLNQPFQNYWNQYSIYGILLFLSVYVFVVFFHIMGRKNYMFGKEYGSSSLADPKVLTKELADHDDKRKDNVVVETKTKTGVKTQIVNTMNRHISENIQMTIDTKATDLNNNIFVIGGSGAGKSFKFAKPNLMQMFGSYVVTDPKGEMVRDSAGFLKKHGYKIKVLNLLNAKEMKKSIHYNPFKYLKEDTDVIRLINQMIANTTPKGASAGSDPFWEKAETMLWLALFFYVWKEGVVMSDGSVRRNFPAVMELLKKAEFKTDSRGNKIDSELDKMMSRLEQENADHPAVVNYNKSMRGAADTVRSIIISANARLAVMGNDVILDLLSEDEIDIETIGREKTILYCVISDTDKSYNFIVGMLYSQIFNELYYQADFVYSGSLPIHVTFLFDEFANVALPDDFCSLLSTMRSRNISSIIIIQNMAQIKKLFKDDYETIPGNCDVMIYLGGNEQSTHKFVSENMGKMTIDKRSHSETKGKQGSVSSSNDVIGREILMPDEVRKLKKSKCIVFIRGYDPVVDDKIKTWKHPLWKEFCSTQKGYQYDARLERLNREKIFFYPEETESLKRLDIIKEKEYRYEKEVAEKTGVKPPKEYKKRVLQMELSDLMSLNLDEMTEIDLLNLDMDKIRENRMRMEKEQEKQKILLEKQKESWLDVQSLTEEEAMAVLMLRQREFRDSQIKILLRLVHTNKNWEVIVNYFDSEDSEEEIRKFVDKLAG